MEKLPGSPVADRSDFEGGKVLVNSLCLCNTTLIMCHFPQAWSLLEFTRPPTTPSWSVTSTSVRICMPTTSFLGAPPCTLGSRTGCKRKSQPWLQAQWRLKYVLVIGYCTVGWASLSLHAQSRTRSCRVTSENTHTPSITQLLRKKFGSKTFISEIKSKYPCIDPLFAHI